MSAYPAQQFAEKWASAQLTERASAQEHFTDVCRLVGHPTPAEMDPAGRFFTFEYALQKTGGGLGRADVWYDGHFAVEYKGKGKYATLAEAYQQLLRYRENLNNPPLLIVCDIEHWEIHTNFTGSATEVHRFTNGEIGADPQVLRKLHDLFYDPARFDPRRQAERVTEEAARIFGRIAEHMRGEQTTPERIARFLTRLVFCLFAEDIGLLPRGASGRGLFSELVEQTRDHPGAFAHYAEQLFEAMAQGGTAQLRAIRYFDGGLFDDDVRAEPMIYEALIELGKACRLDWTDVDPSIFGQLFERSLDPAKRAQLGAHYTSFEDIRLIVEPVLMQPLRREWAAIRAEGERVRAKYDAALAGGTRAVQLRWAGELRALRERMLHRLRTITVLDPACGSGNFLYVALQRLMDLEQEVIHHALFAGLPLVFPEVHPHQMHGIEKDAIAHDLATVVVWIGYIQWRVNNAYLTFSDPILKAGPRIERKDAILAFDAAGKPCEPEWPAVDVIVSNPPFLGGSKLRGELGDAYVETLWKLYQGRVPGGADLVCYWFEFARTSLQAGKVSRVGLLATNSIRGGANREVLNAITRAGDIFMAWSDRPWVLDGAAVRVSMVGFDDGTEPTRVLDGVAVPRINSDLTGLIDITGARFLSQNQGLAFRGNQKGGPFDIDFTRAQALLAATNQSGRSNAEVVKPWWNGLDVTRRPRDMWLIDFGPTMSLEEAQLFELPMEQVKQFVKPERDTNNRKAYRDRWWIHNEPRPAMRRAIRSLRRFLVTPHVSKHRVWLWLGPDVIPDHQLIVVASDQDYFFGVLHSTLHEVWSLRMGTSLEDRPRYTPTTTFETFPFPWPPGHEPTDHPAYAAISAAAAQLHAERDGWLNPPGVPERALAKRTLTNLYNALQIQRGAAAGKVERDAAAFAPRLDALHRALDGAVCDAYGWEHALLADEEEILRRLLALNLARSAQGPVR